jgi:pyruvate dehydrogenase E2 component (dihydrolipoamide acetyltransferase)
MPIQVLMPALSPTMEEGKLAKWLKAEGDAVKPGDVIAEIETDKATMEVEAADEGVLGKILVEAGTEGVKVNTPIALLLGEGEDKGALANAAPASAGNGAGAAKTEVASVGAELKPVPTRAPAPSAPPSSGSGWRSNT